jgi:hypothetical protein
LRSLCLTQLRHHRSVGLGRGRDRLEDGRQGNGERAADGIDGGAWSGPQQGATAILLDLDLAEFVEIMMWRPSSRCRKTLLVAADEVIE